MEYTRSLNPNGALFDDRLFELIDKESLFFDIVQEK